MSRSWKRHPIVKDKCSHRDKQMAAARVRNIPIDSEENDVLVAAPANFKKVNHDTWSIHDYTLRWTLEDAIEDYYESATIGRWKERFLSQYPTLEDYLRKCWAKYYKRK